MKAFWFYVDILIGDKYTKDQVVTKCPEYLNIWLKNEFV